MKPSGIERPIFEGTGTGLLVINADDWGLDRETTDRIYECALGRRISTVSAMVFMEDSERAAEMSRGAGIIAGLHLNFTTPFSDGKSSAELVERQRKITASLRRHRFARGLYHPGLRNHFEYMVTAQIEEFQRLYGAPPERLDGHHHMHLCPNVLVAGLLPAGTTVRRNFSFRPGEKSVLNRLYRAIVDRKLARRHNLADYFFSLAPLHPSARVQAILSLAKNHTVEVETHPALVAEYEFLTRDELPRLTQNIRMMLPSPLGRNPIACA